MGVAVLSSTNGRAETLIVSSEFRGSHWNHFCRFCYKIGRCRLLLRVGPAVAAELFEMWNIATNRLTAENRREFEVAPRDVDKARVRLRLEQSRSEARSDAVMRGVDRNVFAEPSDDEFPPAVSNGAFLAKTFCPA